MQTRIVCLAAIGLYIAHFFAAPSALPMLCVCAVIVTLSTVLRDDRVGFSVSLLVTLLLAWNTTVQFSPWSLPLLVPLGALLATSWIPRAGSSIRVWLRAGTMDRTTVFLMLGTVLLQTLWVVWLTRSGGALDPAHGNQYTLNTMALLTLGVMSVTASAAEESVFRGVFFDAVDRTSPHPFFAVLFSAIAYGCAQRFAAPGGWMSIGAGALLGLCLGIIRQRADGLVAPFITHTLALFAGFVVTVGRP